MAAIDRGLEDRGRRLTLSAAVLLLAACQSNGIPGGAKCEPRLGMTTAALVACRCEIMSSGGAAMVGTTSGEPRRASTVADYICPMGKGTFGRVTVVDGVVRDVYH